jgi:hypothetical protein
MRRALFISLSLLVCLVLVSSCAHRADTPAVRAWLDTVAANQAAEVGGNWIGPLTGWGYYGMFPFGVIALVQQDHKLTGAWAESEILGAVSGSTVILVALDGGSASYTFHLTLTPTKDAMIGKYCDGYYQTPDDDCRAITLTKAR